MSKIQSMYHGLMCRCYHDRGHGCRLCMLAGWWFFLVVFTDFISFPVVHSLWNAIGFEGFWKHD